MSQVRERLATWTARGSTGDGLRPHGPALSDWGGPRHLLGSYFWMGPRQHGGGFTIPHATNLEHAYSMDVWWARQLGPPLQGTPGRQPRGLGRLGGDFCQGAVSLRLVKKVGRGGDHLDHAVARSRVVAGRKVMITPPADRHSQLGCSGLPTGGKPTGSVQDPAVWAERALSTEDTDSGRLYLRLYTKGQEYALRGHRVLLP